MGDRPYFLCPRPWGEVFPNQSVSSPGGRVFPNHCPLPGREGLPKSVSPPLEGGDEGEGENFHPHPGPLPSRERVIFSLFCHCSNIDDSV
jgi:hypothetical protein